MVSARERFERSRAAASTVANRDQERFERMRISSSIDRANAKKKQAEAKKAIANREKEKAVLQGNTDIGRAWYNATNPKLTDFQKINSKMLNAVSRNTGIPENKLKNAGLNVNKNSGIVEYSRSKAQKELTGVEYSNLTKSINKWAENVNRRSKNITEKNRKFYESKIGGKTGKYLGEASTYLGRIVSDNVNLIAGGKKVSDLAIQKPSAIPYGAVVLGHDVPKGMYQAAKDDPAYFLTSFVASYGAIKAVGAAGAATKGTIKYSGKKYVPPENVIRPEVLSGKVTFPTAKMGTDINHIVKLFDDSKYKYPGAKGSGGYHASPVDFGKKTKVLSGSSETPGLYIGPDVSPHFLRTGGKTNYKLIGWDTKNPNPTIDYIDVRGINRLPYDVRLSESIANKYMSTHAEKGSAYITHKLETGIKKGPREREAVIPTDSVLVQKEFKYYTKVNGQKVPIKRYQAVSQAEFKNSISYVDKLFSKTRKGKSNGYSSSRSTQQTKALITPGKTKYTSSSVAASVSKPYTPIGFIRTIGELQKNYNPSRSIPTISNKKPSPIVSISGSGSKSSVSRRVKSSSKKSSSKGTYGRTAAANKPQPRTRIPKIKKASDSKKGKKKVSRISKEYSPYQIKRQMAGIESLF